MLFVAQGRHAGAPWPVPVALLVVMVGMRLATRTPKRIELVDDNVTFVLPIRKVRVPATDIHRLRRTRVMRNVVAETTAGRLGISGQLRGLHGLAVQLQTLNPALVIDGP